MRLLLDSSVFIAFFNDLDIFHQETLNLVKKFSQDQVIELILPIIVFLEVAHVLSKQLEKFQDDLILKIFITSETIDLNYTVAKEILPIMKKINLKTSDAIIVAIAKLTNSTLVTWDKKLQKNAQKSTKILTPKELLQ